MPCRSSIKDLEKLVQRKYRKMSYKYEISDPEINIQDLLMILQKENLIAAVQAEHLKRVYKGNKCKIYIHSKAIRVHFTNQNMNEKFIYIARKGHSFDGHSLAEEVLKSGNIFIGEEKQLLNLQNSFEDIISHPLFINVTDTEKTINILFEYVFDIKKEKFTTIGITGTNGKTSVTQISAQILEKLYKKDILKIGTLGMQAGAQIFPVSHSTTPDYPSFLYLLNSAQKNNVSHIVMEMTSHGLKEKRLHHWMFDVAVFTNLTLDHLDYHKTMNDYRNSKKILFTSYLKENGTAVICTNNEEWVFFSENEQNIKRKIIGTGYQNAKEIFFQKCKSKWKEIYFLSLIPKESSLNGLSGTLTLENNEGVLSQSDFYCSLIGDFQFENILSSVGVALACGFDLKKITPFLADVKNIQGRLERVISSNKSAPVVLVDYAHTPDALEKALLTCRKLLIENGGGRLICVFGCGGDRDKTKRSLMGKIAAELSDLVVVTSDNPRTEDPESIIADILSGIEKPKNCIQEKDRKKAIEIAVQYAVESDLILIAGKGHEDYQIIGNLKTPFSDVEVARLILSDTLQ